MKCGHVYLLTQLDIYADRATVCWLMEINWCVNQLNSMTKLSQPNYNVILRSLNSGYGCYCRKFFLCSEHSSSFVTCSWFKNGLLLHRISLSCVNLQKVSELLSVRQACGWQQSHAVASYKCWGHVETGLWCFRASNFSVMMSLMRHKWMFCHGNKARCVLRS